MPAMPRTCPMCHSNDVCPFAESTITSCMEFRPNRQAVASSIAFHAQMHDHDYVQKLQSLSRVH